MPGPRPSRRQTLFYTAGPDLSGPYVEVMVCCMLF